GQMSTSFLTYTAGRKTMPAAKISTRSFWPGLITPWNMNWLINRLISLFVGQGLCFSTLTGCKNINSRSLIIWLKSLAGPRNKKRPIWTNWHNYLKKRSTLKNRKRHDDFVKKIFGMNKRLPVACLGSKGGDRFFYLA